MLYNVLMEKRLERNQALWHVDTFFAFFYFFLRGQFYTYLMRLERKIICRGNRRNRLILVNFYTLNLSSISEFVLGRIGSQSVYSKIISGNAAFETAIIHYL
jgi:hypothetical protein